MIPILFDGTATDFTTNGIGRLSDAYSCNVTEEKNGIYELVMKYPTYGKYYSEIQNERIIVAVPFEGGSRQAFVVYEKQENIDKTSMIRAQHISYRANYIPVLPFSTNGILNAISVLNGGVVPGSQNTRLAEPSPFTITTDIVNADTLYQQNLPRSLRACLGGDRGSLLDTYATKGTGEYEWDNFDIKFWNHRGSDKGYTVRYGKNLVSLDRALDSSDLVTGVLPYWTNGSESEGSSIVFPGDVQYIDNYQQYPFKKTVTVDFSTDFESQPTLTQLNARGKEYVDNLGFIKDNIQLEFYDIDDQKVHLCDTITVYYTKLGVNIKQKVIKTVWDVLSERYDTITVGNDESSLSKTLYDAIEDGKQYTNSKMLSVNQRVDYEVGIIENRISSVEEETGKGTLLSVVTVYLRNDGSEPSEYDPNWDTVYPPVGTGGHIWSMTIYEYLDPTSSDPSHTSETRSTPTEITTNGITGVTMEYLAGTDATPNPNDPNWSAIMPTVTEGAVLWTRYKYTYSAGLPTTSTPTKALNSLFDGINDVSSDVSDLSDSLDDAVSSLSGDISDLSDSTDTAISNLNTSLSGDISALSDATDTAISNLNTSLSGDISALSAATDTAISGLDTKIDNTKVLRVETRYAKTPANETTAPNNNDSRWGINYPANVAVGEHIWQQTKTTYVDNTILPAYSTAVEVTERASSDKVTSVYSRYAKTAANDPNPPGNTSSSWSTTYPTGATTGEHIWEQIVTTYVTGDPAYSTATEIKTRGVVNVVTEYALSNTGSGTGPTTGWSESFPSSIGSNQYLWTRNKYLTSSGAVDHYSTASIAQNNIASLISTANSNASSAVSTANAASTTAQNAATTASAANTTAQNAATTADAANTTAQNAATTASAASTAAGNAVTTANAANTAAQNAVTAAGEALKTTTVYYMKSATKPNKPSVKPSTPEGDVAGWSINYPSQNYNERIWTTTYSEFNNGTFAYSSVVEVTEPDVISVVTKYLLTATTSTPSTDDSAGWSETMPSPDNDYPYLWTMTVYTKSNNSSIKGTPTRAFGNLYQAVSGTLTNVETLYAVSTAASAPQSDSDWSTSYPSSSQSRGKHVWQKLRYTFADGHSTYSTATEVTESGIESVVTLYKITTSDTTVPSVDTQVPPTGWSTIVPTVTAGYFLWSIEYYTFHNGSVEHTTPALAMNNFYSKISNHDTRITQTETDISLQSTRITTVSQSIGVNLSPFFGHDFADVVGTDEETDGYWEHAIGSAITQDSNGWAYFDASIANSYFSPVANSEIDFQTLTAVVEISDLTLASSTKPYLRFQNGSNNQQYQAASNFEISADGVYRLNLTKSTVANPTRLVRGLINRGAAGNTFYIRISLFKETYSGDYVPYVTPTNDLEDYIYGLRNAIETANSQININAEGINSIVKTTQSIEDNYITTKDANTLVSGSIAAAKSEIKQDSSRIEASVTRTYEMVDELQQRYEAQVGTFFTFDSDGLEISSTNSDIRGKFDQDSLDFLNQNDTKFGWVSAEDGVGGNKVSIGDAETANKRWLIFPDSTGKELRFARHS